MYWGWGFQHVFFGWTSFNPPQPGNEIVQLSDIQDRYMNKCFCQARVLTNKYFNPFEKQMFLLSWFLYYSQWPEWVVNPSWFLVLCWYLLCASTVLILGQGSANCNQLLIFVWPPHLQWFSHVLKHWETPKRKIIFHDMWKLHEVQILVPKKFYWSTATLIHLHITYSCFHPPQAELRSCKRDHLVRKG